MSAKPQRTLLVTSAEFAADAPDMMHRTCARHGVRAVYNPKPGAMSSADIIDFNRAEPIHGILVYSSSDGIDRDMFQACDQLRVVSRHGVGIDNFDQAAAREAGVVIRTTIGLDDHQSVADLAFGLLLSAARQIPQTDRELRSGLWNRRTGVNAWRKTLGVVGFGRIGRAMARRAAGFEMKIIAFDPFPPPPGTGLCGAKLVDLDTLLAESDFVSLHCPLSDSNQAMIGPDQMAAMKPTAYLINTARAELIDQAALKNALADRTIAGACLDVFPSEPATEDPLIAAQPDNLITTPHVGSYTTETLSQLDMTALTNALETMTED